MTRKRRFVTRTILAVSLLILTPWTFHGNEGIEQNTACSREADGVCAREIDSVCTLGPSPAWNHYNKAEGP